MGIFNKLTFWKKKDELDFDELAGKEAADTPPFDELEEKLPGLEEKPMFPEEDRPERLAGLSAARAVPPPPAGSRDRELELISSKLDTVKALLASLDQRLANLEKSAGVAKKERLW